jgi:hypothetical protein
MTEQPFSRRHNYSGAAKEITIREDAPEGLRSVVLEVATDLDMSPSTLRSILCRILRKRPDQSNWSEYPNIWSEVQYLMYNANWYKVYDIIEKIYEVLTSDSSRIARDRHPQRFADEVNAYFEEEGVGWKLVSLSCVEQKRSRASSVRRRPHSGMPRNRRPNHIFTKLSVTFPGAPSQICQAQFTTLWAHWNALPVIA